jgi:hypothetical protein
VWLAPSAQKSPIRLIVVQGGRKGFKGVRRGELGVRRGGEAVAGSGSGSDSGSGSRRGPLEPGLGEEVNGFHLIWAGSLVSIEVR